jgi:N-acetylmuramoyl-L-alanine amidase
MTHTPITRRAATVVSLALLLSVIGWFPAARGSPFPKTEASRIKVSAAALLGSEAPAGLSAAGSTLKATRAATTGETTLCAPLWFTGVGLAWRQTGRGHVEASIRFGPSRESLGEAAVVESAGDHSPDPGTPEYDAALRSTSVLWTGGGRCIRFSLTVPGGTTLAGLEAVFVNTSGTASGPGTGPGQSLASAPGWMLGATGVAEAMTTSPHMVPRWRWGADDSLNNCDPYYAPEVKMGFVHHTAGSNDYSPSESDDILRGIQYFHTEVNGWCDIAYNFLVDRFGTIFIGRKGGPARPTVPGATQGFNFGSFAVSAMGNFHEVPVPVATLDAIKRVLAWRLDVAHLPPTGWATMTSAGGPNTRYPQGARVTLSVISGHRRTGYTSCPGDHLNELLSQIRSDVDGMGLPKIYRADQTETAILPGVDTVTFTALGSEPLSWQVDLKGPAGEVLRSFDQQGIDLWLEWGGLHGDGVPFSPGTYRVLIAGTSTAGASARAAKLWITISLEPSPSPTVSPTPSPTPTPSPSPSGSPSPSPSP